MKSPTHLDTVISLVFESTPLSARYKMEHLAKAEWRALRSYKYKPVAVYPSRRYRSVIK